LFLLRSLCQAVCLHWSPFIDPFLITFLELIHVPYTVPDLFPNVWSPQLSIAIDYPPLTQLILTPSAPNTVFQPSTLIFNSATTHVEFTMMASQPTQFNTYPFQEYYLAPSVLSWTVSGGDAAKYSTISTYTYNVLPRMLFIYLFLFCFLYSILNSFELISSTGDANINYIDSQYLNVSFAITFTTTYPPNGTLILTPVGNFLFSPTSITLTNTDYSAIFIATPIAAGDNYFQLVYSGTDVNLYTQQGIQYVFVSNCMSFSSLFYLFYFIILFYFTLFLFASFYCV
jgi:hypothetical protein